MWMTITPLKRSPAWSILRIVPVSSFWGFGNKPYRRNILSIVLVILVFTGLFQSFYFGVLDLNTCKVIVCKSCSHRECSCKDNADGDNDDNLRKQHDRQFGTWATKSGCRWWFNDSEIGRGDRMNRFFVDVSETCWLQATPCQIPELNQTSAAWTFQHFHNSKLTYLQGWH